MRKIFVFFMALIGLGLMLGGCVSPIGTTKIPAAPVIKNYIEPLKPKKNQVVGNKNIKFYVGKVVDSRKSKRLAPKGLFFTQGQFIMKNEKDFIKVAKATISKAIVNTGWSLTDNRKSANYTVNANIKTMDWERGFFYGNRVVKAKMCIIATNNNSKIYQKEISNSIPVIVSGLVPGGINLAGKPFEDFYHALVKFFSSPEFVNVVEHKSVVFDNSSNSKPLSN